MSSSSFLSMPQPARLLSQIVLIQALGFSGLAAQEPQGVTLKPNDIVRMEVFGQDDLAAQTRVMKSGKVSFPLIGTVEVGGLTVDEAIERVRVRYAAKYLVDPKVTLTVDEYASEFVSVIGAVNSGGQVPLPANGRLDLSTALAGAGGLSQLADRNKIVLNRADGTTRTFTAEGIEKGAAVPLGVGDRVIVHQSGFVNKTVTILGQVRKPGPVPMPLDGELDLIGAVALAGGFTELANPKKVSVNRQGKVTSLNVKEMADQGNTRFFLLSGDIINVAERWF